VTAEVGQAEPRVGEGPGDGCQDALPFAPGSNSSSTLFQILSPFPVLLRKSMCHRITPLLPYRRILRTTAATLASQLITTLVRCVPTCKGLPRTEY
jgi:hypothetical protein